MLNILVVEDYPMVAKRIRRFVAAILDVTPEAIPWCEDFEQAEHYLAENPVEVLLLDLNLAGEDGFDLLKRGTAGAFETIVISANTARALEAFELGVVDFVAKPFDQARLATALGRVKQRREQSVRTLTIKKHGRIQLVDIADVVAVKSEGNYAELWTRDGETLLHAKSLEQLSRVLPETYLRVHKSYIVCLGEIKSLKRPGGGRYGAVLKNGTEIPIGRGRWPEVQRRVTEPG
ncbi:LytR/AlgR family response regulator transcription factor [Acanthopleuribacter pedis]|uniref:Response regulator transcription factor n=1 Tax=Acanthopleuribacter pedis TaxID=442870 RepID=A0A8J7Q550_9BACT|nr:LytTR family DNA-binding domain-containing protein [Acanthopleuribacter pedis]MBO1318076.1 response regulator transcription factor [Acanthopleuribacter pedis]